MSLEQKVAELVTASDQLTGLVERKIEDINHRVQQAQQEVSTFLTSARQEFPYINLFHNSFATLKDEEEKLKFPISTYNATTLAEVVPFASVPDNIKSTVPRKFNGISSMPCNALHLIFSPNATPSYWLPGNPVAGLFSGGFGHVYVVSGSMSGYGPGEHGPRVQYCNRNGQAWHIDMTYGASPGAEVYLFAPFIVTGYCHDAGLVQYIPTVSAVLDHHIS